MPRGYNKQLVDYQKAFSFGEESLVDHKPRLSATGTVISRISGGILGNQIGQNSSNARGGLSVARKDKVNSSISSKRSYEKDENEGRKINKIIRTNEKYVQPDVRDWWKEK
jgi:uncharacterized protein YcfJ